MPLTSRPAHPWLAATLAALTACVGSVSRAPDSKEPPVGQSPQPTQPPGTSPPPPGSPDPGTPPGAEAGPMPLLALSRAEYANVIRDLLGVSVSTTGFTPEIAGSSGFATPGLVTEVEVGQYQLAAEAAVKSAAAKVPTLAPCDVGTRGERGCAEELVRTFGKRAYRRPVTDEEVTLHMNLYDKQLRQTLGLPHAEALQALVVAMLQSPAFLYHWERGPAPVTMPGGDGTVPLDNYERASRLSFFFWQSMPDAELFTAADTRALATAAGVEAQARRLLASDRANATIDKFHREWLELRNAWPKDGTKYPLWVGGTDVAAVNDVLSTLRNVLRKGTGTFTEMMTTRTAFVNEKLAKVYGLPGIVGDKTVEATLDARQRPGLLTRIALVAQGANAVEGDPTKRGALVRTQFLCQTLVAPDMNVPPLPVAGNLNPRQRHEMHFKDPACSGCHRFTDLIGFGFSHYDAIGAFVPVEHGVPLDASGTVFNIDGEDRAYKDAVELHKILDESDEVRRCLAKQWSRFALRRDLEPADEKAFAGVVDRFARSNWDVRELLVAVASSKSFLNRAPVAGEVKP